MELQERITKFDTAKQKFEMALHGADPTGGADSETLPGQPSVGSDPTQGDGTTEWQRALRMGLQVNARNRRN